MKRIRLIRAEWHKLITRGTYQRFLFMWCTCGLAWLLVIGIYSRVDPNSLPVSPEENLPFNQVIQKAVDILFYVGKFSGMAFLAHLVGSEYSGSTWKMVLPRHGNRVDFLVAKLVCWVMGIAVFMAITVAVALLGGWLACAVAGIDFWDMRPVVTDLPLGPQEFQLVMLGLMLLNTLYLGALGFTAAILSRSTLGGVLTGFVAPFMLMGVSELSRSAARLVPGMNVENLFRIWVPLVRPLEEALFDVPVSATQSVVVILAFSALAFLVGGVVFIRRDIAGE